MESDTSSPEWALIDAASQGNLAGVKSTLQSGADINFLYNSEDGTWGALHLAAYNGHLEIVNFLLENNADLDTFAAFFEGEIPVNGTALHLAAHAGQLKVMEALIAKGANLNGSDGTYDYLTPLHTAVRDGKMDAVKLLLDKGADINAFNGAEDTAITIAAENGQLEILQFLVSKGSSLNVSSNVQTPLLAAAENGHLNVVKYLVEKGLNINEGTKFRKDTPLHMAAQNGYADVVSFLLEKGADTKILNNDGKTAAEIASPEIKAIIAKKK
jgi:ankyrin repeat protein